VPQRLRQEGVLSRNEHPAVFSCMLLADEYQADWGALQYVRTRKSRMVRAAPALFKVGPPVPAQGEADVDAPPSDGTDQVFAESIFVGLRGNGFRQFLGPAAPAVSTECRLAPHEMKVVRKGSRRLGWAMGASKPVRTCGSNQTDRSLRDAVGRRPTPSGP
jgi:hypothetical protein